MLIHPDCLREQLACCRGSRKAVARSLGRSIPKWMQSLPVARLAGTMEHDVCSLVCLFSKSQQLVMRGVFRVVLFLLVQHGHRRSHEDFHPFGCPDTHA
mmetsp:Transcript_4227/g.26872  ORF Transcript_4227/g.26872 Transcript_4227/m.26872 type:complete len:99 (+) Transcript_4227:2612-2908(+)